MGIAITTGILCIVSFIIGAYVGQKVVKQEPVISLPKIETFESKKEREKELERTRIITENIDSYDGTGFGQQRLPD